MRVSEVLDVDRLSTQDLVQYVDSDVVVRVIVKGNSGAFERPVYTPRPVIRRRHPGQGESWVYVDEGELRRWPDWTEDEPWSQEGAIARGAYWWPVGDQARDALQQIGKAGRLELVMVMPRYVGDVVRSVATYAWQIDDQPWLYSGKRWGFPILKSLPDHEWLGRVPTRPDAGSKQVLQAMAAGIAYAVAWDDRIAGPAGSSVDQQPAVDEAPIEATTDHDAAVVDSEPVTDSSDAPAREPETQSAPTESAWSALRGNDLTRLIITDFPQPLAQIWDDVESQSHGKSSRTFEQVMRIATAAEGLLAYLALIAVADLTTREQGEANSALKHLRNQYSKSKKGTTIGVWKSLHWALSEPRTSPLDDGDGRAIRDFAKSPQVGEAVTEISEARNSAAHGGPFEPDRVPTTFTALETLFAHAGFLAEWKLINITTLEYDRHVGFRYYYRDIRGLQSWREYEGESKAGVETKLHVVYRSGRLVCLAPFLITMSDNTIGFLDHAGRNDPAWRPFRAADSTPSTDYLSDLRHLGLID